MGALEQYTDDMMDPTAAGVVPGMMPAGLGAFAVTSPFAPNPMAGAAMDLSKDLYADYTRARDASAKNREGMRQASDALSKSYMEGYDPNAYGAQAWAQAGIGAAAPTLSALESLNRAVAGYSGVKLQQRQDLGKRIEQEKQEKLRQQQVEQQIDSQTKENSAQKILDLYKTGQITRTQLATALTQRYVNVPGRGLVDKWKLAQGENGVVVPGFEPVKLLQQMQKDTAAQLEQDKNLHFESAEAYQAAYNKILQGKIMEADKLSGGTFSNQLGEQKIDPYTPMNVTEPAQPALETLKTDPYTVTAAAGTPEAEKEALLKAAEADFQKNGAQMPEGAPAPAPTPQIASQGNIMPATEQMPAQGTPLPATPWGRYALRPVPAPKPKQPISMFSKVEQEREIERAKQSERWAEEKYKDVAVQSTGVAGWYDSLRQMEDTDLKSAGSFANVRSGVGKLLESMGYPNADMAKDARNLTGLNNLIMQGIQSRLSVQNGVQARDDAEREKQSFAQITDPEQVFRYVVKQAKAKALRQMEQEEFYRTWKQDKGSFVGAETAWNDYIKDTPLFTNYGGRPTYINQFVEAYVAKNKDAFDKEGIDEAKRVEIATDAWRKIAKRKK